MDKPALPGVIYAKNRFWVRSVYNTYVPEKTKGLAKYLKAKPEFKFDVTRNCYRAYSHYHNKLIILKINAEDLLQIDPSESKVTTKEENMKQLYQIKDTETFGYVLVTNSKGEYVFEEKGSGKTYVVAKDNVEEVTPFTFSVIFGPGASEYHFTGDAESVSEGDFLIRADRGSNYSDNFPIVQVTGVDTKSKRASADFAGFNITKGKPV